MNTLINPRGLSSQMSNKVSRIAVYPGSFDPVTYGHLDIIQRSVRLFDFVIVLVGDNPQKKPLFSPKERVDMIQKSVTEMPSVSVEHFDGLLLDFVRRKGASVIIRGLRAVSDFEYEFQRALLNRDIDPSIETVFIMTKDNYAFLNSSIVKEIAQFAGPVSSYVPEIVAQKLNEKFKK